MGAGFMGAACFGAVAGLGALVVAVMTVFFLWRLRKAVIREGKDAWASWETENHRAAK